MGYPNLQHRLISKRTLIFVHLCATDIFKQWPNLKNLSGGLNLSRGLNMVRST